MSNLWFYLHRWVFYSLNGTFLLLIGCVSISDSELLVQNRYPEGILSLPDDIDELDKESIQNYLQKFSEKNKDTSSQWWVRYQKAKLWEAENNEKACLSFKELAEEKDFPLYKLASIKKKAVCRVSEKDLIKLKQILENRNDRWLHRLAAEVGADQALHLSLSSYLSYFQYKLSFYTPLSSEKIDLLEQSIANAKSVKDNKQKTLSSKRLYKIAPRLMPNGKISPFKLAYDYRKARQFDEAISIYKSIISDNKSSLYEVYLSLKHLRTVSKLMNNKKDVLKYSFQVSQVTKNGFLQTSNRRKRRCHRERTRLYHDGALLYAKTLWTQGRRGQAEEVLQTTQQNLKKCKTSGRIYWVLTQMREEAKDFEGAISWAKQGLAIARYKSKTWEEIKWRLAWNLRKTLNFQEAIAQFQEIIKTTKDKFLRSKYTYWMARTFEDMGDRQQAESEFQKLTETNTIGYYGLLAYRSLKKPIPAFNYKQDTIPKRFIASKPKTTVIDENLVRWLISVNEKDLAKSYLRTKKRKIARGGTEMKNIIDYFSIAGDHMQVFSYLSKMSFDPRKDEMLSQLLFPTPYLKQITELSYKYAVPKELIYSIIRQESAFDKYARSPADAFGLMQLLPRVAQKTAEISKVPYSSVDDLYHPKTNLSLGIFHLRQLLDKFDNQFIMAVASYNAPEDAVRNWVKDRFHNNPVEFIEDIPYKETRLYVKLVMRNLIFYQSLFSDKDIPFPEWCLDGLQSFKS